MCLVHLWHHLKALLANIEWVNAVAIPAIMTVTLGLYAGLVGTRMFAFFQVRTKAACWVLRLKETFDSEYESPFELSIAFTTASQEILTEIRGLGHEKLTGVLQDIILHHFAVWARLVRIETPPHRIPKFPNKEQMQIPLASRGLEVFGALLPGNATPEETAHHVWRKLLADCRDEYAARFSSHVARISSIGPNWGTLLNPLFFPNYLSTNGGLIGLIVRRPSLRARVAIRLKRILTR